MGLPCCKRELRHSGKEDQDYIKTLSREERYPSKSQAMDSTSLAAPRTTAVLILSLTKGLSRRLPQVTAPLLCIYRSTDRHSLSRHSHRAKTIRMPPARGGCAGQLTSYSIHKMTLALTLNMTSKLVSCVAHDT